MFLQCCQYRCWFVCRTLLWLCILVKILGSLHLGGSLFSLYSYSFFTGGWFGVSVFQGFFVVGFYYCVHVFHAATADFCSVFFLNILCSLCPVAKCFSISFINCPPTFALTLALNGGLNHIIFLGRFFFRFVLGSDLFFENFMGTNFQCLVLWGRGFVEYIYTGCPQKAERGIFNTL